MHSSSTIDRASHPLREVAAGIFYTSAPFVSAGPDTVEALRAAAARVAVRRARLCAHPAPDAAQHDMLIVSLRDTYVAPHRHLGKTESFVVLDGEADCLLFADDGRLEEVVPMAPPGSGRTFFYRMPAGRFHSLRIRSADLVFFESTSGPFRLEDTDNAAWAPGPKEDEAGRAYIASLFDPAASPRLAPFG